MFFLVYSESLVSKWACSKPLQHLQLWNLGKPLWVDNTSQCGQLVCCFFWSVPLLWLLSFSPLPPSFLLFLLLFYSFLLIFSSPSLWFSLLFSLPPFSFLLLFSPPICLKYQFFAPLLFLTYQHTWNFFLHVRCELKSRIASIHLSFHVDSILFIRLSLSFSLSLSLFISENDTTRGRTGPKELWDWTS